uniref:Sulfur globule protein CV3 n=1 Tax=Strongyloides papillosus TaxID=174720 RepID=A0A0N5CCB3_STREA
MSTKLILAFIAAVLAIASAGGPFGYGYGYGLGHYGFGGLPYGGYLGFRRFGYNGYPGFSKLGYGHPYWGVSAYNYSPYYNGHPVSEYGYPFFGKDISYTLPYKGYGDYVAPYGGVSSVAAASSSSAVGF